MSDGGDALARCAHKVARKHEEGIGLCLRTAHTSTQLVKIGKAKEIRAINNDRIGIGNIQSTFDNCRRDKHVGIACYEGAHDRFELVLAHLTMADDDARLRTELSNALGDAFDCLDPVMKEIHLPAAHELPMDGIPKNSLVVGADDRLYGLPIERRGFNE